MGWVAFVDVGNMGESRSRVTEGGQECEQGMLGNQQVLPVSVPPCCKGRLWVTRGQVCTGNQMFFFAAASNHFLNEQPLGADSPLVISEPMGGVWGRGVWTSEVMLMPLKMKSKHLVPHASAPIIFFFSKPFSSLKLSFDSGSVMNQP